MLASQDFYPTLAPALRSIEPAISRLQLYRISIAETKLTRILL
jgi:hypothetical protein